MEQEPLLIFRENYGKFFVATVRKPEKYIKIYIYCMAGYVYSYRRTLARKRGDKIYKWRLQLQTLEPQLRLGTC